MVDKSQVYGKIKECLVEALGVEEAEIVPGARIMDDLGAESIDFLDIVFRLEKAFGIKIPRGGDQIQVGDNVIVVTLEHGLHDLRDILDKGAEG